MSRRLRLLLIAATAILLATTTVWFWLLHTSNGARFVWSFIEQRLPGDLTAASIAGDLTDGLRLRSIRYRNDDIQVSTAETNLAVNVDLIPLSVELRVLDVTTVDVLLQDDRDDDETKKVDIAELLSAMRLPIAVIAPDIRLTGLNLKLPDQEPRALISSLRMAGQLHDELRVDRLELVTPFADVSSRLALELQPPFAMRLQADATIKNVGFEDIAGLELTVKGDGDAERINIDLNSIAPELSVNGTIVSLFEVPVLDLRVRSSRLGWPIRSNEPEFHARNLEVSALGSIEEYEVSAAAEISLQELGDVVVNVAGSGSLEHFRIDEASARGDRLEASATGELDWSGGLGLVTEVTAERFDPRGWLAGWPGAHPLQGDISASWHQNDIDVPHIELSVADTYISVSANGQIDTSANVVDGALTWRGIQWPFDAEVPAFQSNSGEITVKGKPSAWSVDGVIMLQTKALPEGKLTINGNGDLDGIALTLQDSDILGGNVRGHGNYRWRDNHPFSASLQIEQIQTAALSSDWPGVLIGDADIEGAALPFSINIDVAELSGEIRDRAVVASGALSFAPGSIGFRNFDLMHGDSTVALDGRLYAEDGVTYRLKLADVGNYTDAAGGSLEGSGSVSLDSSNPRLRGNLSAKEILIGDIEIASLEIKDNAVASNEFINQSFVARELRTNSQTIDTLSITAIGDADRHALEVDLQSAELAVSLEASGAIADWQQLATVAWQGELKVLQLESPDGLTLALDSPVSLEVSANEILLEQSCLDIQKDKALCLRAHWIRATSIDLAAELQSFPLHALTLLSDTDLDITQEISGELSWSSAGNKSKDAFADLEISPGRIVSTFDSRLALDTGRGILGFQIADGSLGSGTFDLPFPDYGAVDIDFSVGDVGLGASSPLSGRALIDMSDISILAELFPFIDSDGGRLATNLTISGTLSSPSIEGELTLRDANLRYRPLGTTLSDLQIDAVILENNQLDLEGRFVAGEGNGMVVTSAAYEAGTIPDLEFEIRGSNLLLIDDPEMRVIGDPDLKIGFHDRALQLDGKIRIPEADLTPSVIPETPILESDDVTIVSGKHPDKGQTAADEQKFRITGTLEVELGENVSVDLGVANATLGGSVIFEWQDELIPVAKGSYTVDGTIAAVGQVLNVHEGTISFPEVPANNPHLNIAAEREIYGNTQVKTAGILLTGTAKKPIMEAYTYPLTTEERALTLLATGSDFDYEQGVGALDFGMYIAPRFYLSYGIGLFDRDNIISARYDLKRGFGIKASSGQRESGVDLSYQLDR